MGFRALHDVVDHGHEAHVRVVLQANQVWPDCRIARVVVWRGGSEQLVTIRKK